MLDDARRASGRVAITLAEIVKVVHGEEVEVGRGPARELLEDSARLDAFDHRPIDAVAPGEYRLGPRDLAPLAHSPEVPVHVDVIEEALVSVRLRGPELVAPLGGQAGRREKVRESLPRDDVFDRGVRREGHGRRELLHPCLDRGSTHRAGNRDTVVSVHDEVSVAHPVQLDRRESLRAFGETFDLFPAVAQ